MRPPLTLPTFPPHSPLRRLSSAERAEVLARPPRGTFGHLVHAEEVVRKGVVGELPWDEVRGKVKRLASAAYALAVHGGWVVARNDAERLLNVVGYEVVRG